MEIGKIIQKYADRFNLTPGNLYQSFIVPLPDQAQISRVAWHNWHNGDVAHPRIEPIQAALVQYPPGDWRRDMAEEMFQAVEVE